MQNKEYKCSKCGSGNMQLHTEVTTKSTVGKIAEWLKICNENLLFQFYYRTHAKKMQKAMPTYLEKHWVCPECGEKHTDYEEVVAKFQFMEKIDIGVMFFWILSLVSAILMWVFCFGMEGIGCLFLVEAVIFMLVMFIKYGLRKTIFQLQHDLIKYGNM